MGTFMNVDEAIRNGFSFSRHLRNIKRTIFREPIYFFSLTAILSIDAVTSSCLYGSEYKSKPYDRMCGSPCDYEITIKKETSINHFGLVSNCMVLN